MPPTQGPLGQSVPLQIGATTGNGSVVAPHPKATHHRITITGIGTVSAGTISIEEADSDSYSGTWSVFQAPAAPTFTTASQYVIHLFGTIANIRARITSNITGGGTVNVDIVST